MELFLLFYGLHALLCFLLRVRFFHFRIPDAQMILGLSLGLAKSIEQSLLRYLVLLMPKWYRGFVLCGDHHGRTTWGGWCS